VALRIFNPTIAAEGRQNVAEKGHSFSERREAEIEPPESAYLRVDTIGVAEFGQSAVSPCTFKGRGGTLVRMCGELKSATCKTVRASTPYPPVLEPGIEEIGCARAQSRKKSCR
jgi:hypothetical protein